MAYRRYRGGSTPIGRLAAAMADDSPRSKPHRRFDSRDVTTYGDGDLLDFVNRARQAPTSLAREAWAEANRRGLLRDRDV